MLSPAALILLSPLALTLTLTLASPSSPSPGLTPRAACQGSYDTDDYCGWFCSDCTIGPPGDLGCIGFLCVDGCKAAVGREDGGRCRSHWNDGNTWAFRCDHGSDSTWGMSRWKMTEMGLDCWGGSGGAGEEFWCLC